MASHKYLTLEGLSIFKDNIMSIIEDNELTIAAALNRIPMDISNGVQTAVSNKIQPASAEQYELTLRNDPNNTTAPRAFYMLVNNKTNDTGDFYYTNNRKSYDREGILSKTTQTIAGEKQFANNIRILNYQWICDGANAISGASGGYIYFGNPEWQIKNDAFISYTLSTSWDGCDDISPANQDTSLSIKNKNSQITLKRNDITINTKNDITIGTNVALPSNKTIKIGGVNVSLEGHTHEFNINGTNGTLETILSNLSSSLNTHISTGSHVLPYSSNDISKVLGVVAGTDGTTPTLSWVTGLPTYNTTNDKDKYLHITANGSALEWASLPVASKTSSGIVSTANQAFEGMKTFWGGLRTNKISAYSTDSSISSKLYVQDVKDLYLQFVKTSAAPTTIHLTNTNLFVDGATYDKAIKIAGNYVYLNGQIMLNDTPIEDLLGNTDLPIASGFHIPDYDGQGSNYFLAQTMSAGILTTERQSIAGEKHFNDGIRLVNAIATCGGEDTYGGVWANQPINPDNHTDTPKISFGYGNKTYIYSTPLYCPSNEYPTQKFDKSDSVLCINSPGFNILRTNSDIDDTLSISFAESANNYGTYAPTALQHYSSGNGYHLLLGKLTSGRGATSIQINSSSLSTSYARIYPQQTYSLSGLLGGENLELNCTDATIVLKLGVGKTGSKTVAPTALYNINAGTFGATVRIFYKFNNQSDYTSLGYLLFSGTLANKGLTSTSVGSTSVTLYADDYGSKFNIKVPDGANSCSILFDLFTNGVVGSSPSNGSTLYLSASGVEVCRNGQGAAVYAYNQGYPYLYTATTSSTAIYVKGISYSTTNFKHKGIPSDGLQNILNTGGVNIVNSVMWGDQYTKFNKFDSLDSHILKSSIIISTPQAKDGSPGYLNAFTKMQDNKIELCSDYGYVQLTSLGLHQKITNLNAFKNTGGGDLLITTGTPYSHIVFGCIDDTNILHKINHGGGEDENGDAYFHDFYPFKDADITLRPFSNGYGYLGTSEFKWGYIYSFHGEFSSNVKAKTFIQSSDADLKTIKGNVNVDLDKLKEIPKIFFKYNEDDDNITRIGTIAQDVQKIYPEIVHTDEDGHLSLEYDKLSVISLKAIDKLYERQIELENEIKDLKEIVLKILNK